MIRERLHTGIYIYIYAREQDSFNYLIRKYEIIQRKKPRIRLPHQIY
jgi:hypothetical protein